VTRPHSAAFQRFQASFDAPGRAFLDQLDTAALLALAEPERTEAEDLLLAALSTDDPRIARALRDLGSTRAIAPLRAALARTQHGRMRVAVARALFELGHDRSAIATIVDVLRRGDRSARETAASVLRVLPVGDVQPALLDALSDRDASVRGLAASALYTLHQLDDLARDYRDRLGVLRMLIASPLPSVAAHAADEIRSVIGALDRGATPQSLGLDRAVDDESPAIKRLLDSHSDAQGVWSELLDVEAIPPSGPDRVWAEDMILSWLPGDHRACRAVADLHLRRAAPALRELVPRAEGRLAIEAAAALARVADDQTGLPRVVEATAPGGADRLRAVEALRDFGDGAAQAALEHLQSDADPRIRAMAAASLLHRSAVPAAR
jgi:HEAT repeat protein